LTAFVSIGLLLAARSAAQVPPTTKPEVADPGGDWTGDPDGEQAQPKDINPFTPEYINEWYVNHKKLIAAQAAQQISPSAPPGPRNGGKLPIENCPISIVSLDNSSNAKAGLLAAIVEAGPSSTYLILKYQSNSAKQVAGIRFAFVYFNSVNEPSDTQDITTPKS
jgi:hypothetical protein